MIEVANDFVYDFARVCEKRCIGAMHFDGIEVKFCVLVYE